MGRRGRTPPAQQHQISTRTDLRTLPVGRCRPGAVDRLPPDRQRRHWMGGTHRAGPRCRLGLRHARALDSQLPQHEQQSAPGARLPRTAQVKIRPTVLSGHCCRCPRRARRSDRRLGPTDHAGHRRQQLAPSRTTPTRRRRPLSPRSLPTAGRRSVDGSVEHVAITQNVVVLSKSRTLSLRRSRQQS